MDTDTLNIISIIVNMGVAIGTFSLAFLAYGSLKNADKQLKLMKEQDNPYLQASNVSFDKNKISFEIENIGYGNAYEIGVMSHYLPVTLTNLTTKNNTLLEVAKIAFEFEDVIKLEPKDQITKWNELFNEGKLKEYYPYLWFELITKELNELESFGNYEIKHNNYVTFAETKYTNLVLTPKAKFDFTCEPSFDAEYFEKIKDSTIWGMAKKNLPMSRHFNIEELIKIMKYNEVSFFHLTFHLKYKNRFETQLESVFLASFVFSVKEHSNLQEAHEQGFEIIRPIGYREREKRLGGVPNYLYENVKSYFNSEK